MQHREFRSTSGHIKRDDEYLNPKDLSPPRRRPLRPNRPGCTVGWRYATMRVVSRTDADGEVARLREVVAGLQAANYRLSRLLDLRGMDTAPAAEQLSAAVAAPGLVTMSSPVGDKLALYADRFRARLDVYAVRWENTRSGASGWMPAVAGGWRRGMDTQLTPAALATFKHAASMANPKFYELQRLRKSTWDTPRFVRGYDLTLDDRIVLPRGLRHVVEGIVERAGSRLAVTDVRNPGREIDLTLAAELTITQAAAVDGLLAHDDGVLVAPPGSGKTVIACAVIAERGTSTLILVDRKALAEQWRSRIDQFLGIKAGQVGGGRRKLGGIVDVAMLPSLARHSNVAELTDGYGQVIVDECHHLAAAAYDHSVKRIGAQFWLGLTATPTRRDGLSDLVTWQLGSVRHTITHDEHPTLAEAADSHSGPQRLLHIHPTEFRHDDADLTAADALAALHRRLVTDEARNTQISDVLDAALRRGRNCLVLSRRVAHLDILTTLMSARGHQAMVLQGGMSVTERHAVVHRLADTKSGDGILVIGTTPFIGEGFDAPALDTLFLAAPISFPGLLIQCAGRVTRGAPGKDTAEVV